MRVAAAQLPGCTGDAAHDVGVAQDAVRAAAADGAGLVLLPELATLPYFGAAPTGTWANTAETVPGPLTETFGALAAELGVIVVLPLHELDATTGARYNAAVVLDATGSIVPAVDRHGVTRASARKLHLPVGDHPPPGFDESVHFTPGGGLGVHDIGDLRVGVLICYDRRFPECWRELRALGADVALVPIAGSGGDDAEFVVGEIRTHARENGIAAAAASKVGLEHVAEQVVENVGESVVVAADGAVLARRGGDEGPGLVTADLDRAGAEAARRDLRYYDHRRTDLFCGSPHHHLEPA